ncbi:hypothetical protein OKA04_14850 [Luteolibacter flavescens]|uniref:EF-hand domain-containing protein n=1 Tax=Luteolibacter flavescens TaxID=1859460 RepID=A0ABT3FR10_9BACT|nr:hypothetical protein [Luteolibacter flavescens]MCW1886014.1 hypothetical protein [Luteolibacter flavescens]
MRQPRNLAALKSVAFATLTLGGFTLPAAAGLLPSNPIFLTADVDLSGTLTIGEYTTTLKAGIGVNAAARKFKSADRNLNGSIDLREFLISIKAIPTPSKAETQFEIADANTNGSLTVDEFAANYNARLSVVKLRQHYLRADANADGSVTLPEYLSFRSGDYDKTKITIFTLADVNADNELDPEEFGYYYARGTAETKIIIQFQKRDANDDGVLTRDEWNPGVRRNATL